MCVCVFINGVLGKNSEMLEKAETAEIFSKSVSQVFDGLGFLSSG